MKKLVCLTIVMLLMLSACGQGADSSTSTPSGTSAASTSSGTDSPIESSSPADGSIFDVAKEGLPVVEEKIELKALVSKNVNVPDWEGHPMTV